MNDAELVERLDVAEVDAGAEVHDGKRDGSRGACRDVRSGRVRFDLAYHRRITGCADAAFLTRPNRMVERKPSIHAARKGPYGIRTRDPRHPRRSRREIARQRDSPSAKTTTLVGIPYLGSLPGAVNTTSTSGPAAFGGLDTARRACCASSIRPAAAKS